MIEGAAVCDFLIGAAGEPCRRCGATWDEHYALPEHVDLDEILRVWRARNGSARRTEAPEITQDEGYDDLPQAVIAQRLHFATFRTIEDGRAYDYEIVNGHVRRRNDSD